MSETFSLIIFGGQGALGSVLVDFFKSKNGVICSIDHGINPKANLSIALDGSLDQQVQIIQRQVSDFDPQLRFDGIISVAGGWAGGNVDENGFLKTTEAMWQRNVQSSLIASVTAGQFLKPGGLLVLTGANAALEPTPGMIAYGLSKAAVHHLTKSLGQDGSGLPGGSKCFAILPNMLDTPNNRKFTPTDDYSSWTPLEDVAKIIQEWLTVPASHPPNGSLVSILTERGQTRIKIN